MAGTVWLFDPRAAQAGSAAQVAQTLGGLAGKVVGFIDNAKPNFSHLVDDLAGLLVSNYGVKRVVKRQKRAASEPAPEAILSELAQQCDVVITGSGD